MNAKIARASALLISLVTLLAMLPPLENSAQAQGGLLAGAWSLMRFFTILTNFAVGAVFAQIAWRGIEAVSPRLVAGLMLAIMLVGLVYNLILTPLVHETIWDVLGDKVHHLAVPLAVPLWWYSFAAPGRLTWRDPILWALYPLVYALYSFVRVAAEGVAYPYFFMDVANLGWSQTLINLTALGGAFLAAGLAVVWLDRRLAAGSGR